MGFLACETEMNVSYVFINEVYCCTATAAMHIQAVILGSVVARERGTRCGASTCAPSFPRFLFLSSALSTDKIIRVFINLWGFTL